MPHLMTNTHAQSEEERAERRKRNNAATFRYYHREAIVRLQQNLEYYHAHRAEVHEQARLGLIAPYEASGIDDAIEFTEARIKEHERKLANQEVRPRRQQPRERWEAEANHQRQLNQNLMRQDFKTTEKESDFNLDSPENQAILERAKKDSYNDND